MFSHPKTPTWQGPQRTFFPLFATKSFLLLPFIILYVVEINDYGIRVLMTLVADLLLTPTTYFLIYRNMYHPVTALVTSVVFFCLWLCGTLFNGFLAYSNELFFVKNTQWKNLCYGETGLQGVIDLLYGVMIGFAAVAVHRWRKGRKEGIAKVESRDTGRV
ncbi:hypothetical protein CC78DRAFT_580810 [Lojkania enalia]|uniref:Integral membrane protein n=1 Tax=Lojkania enalia TaxID=147567 RepID=A0A9P4K7K2_9PLEO|nr:hypothetical protein CC78DRAFT_580810 [Didymosphaeria enalia]